MKVTQSCPTLCCPTLCCPTLFAVCPTLFAVCPTLCSPSDSLLSDSFFAVWLFLCCLSNSLLSIRLFAVRLCDPMDYTVHGNLQARMLEWVVFPFSKGSSPPRDWTQVSRIVGEFFTSWATRETWKYWSRQPIRSPADLPHPGIEPGSSALQSRFSVQFSSVAQSCPTLWDPMVCSMWGFRVLHYLLESTQTHVHWVSDAIQPSHPLLSPSPPDLNLSQHQGLFQWVGSLHQVAKVLELQLQHLSFQWIVRIDFL